jgi:hypothetical protein
VAATWEGPIGGDVVLYVNGEVAAISSTTAEVEDATANLTIGRGAWEWYTFNGAIDEPRIFETVVDGSVIRTWMTRRIDAGHPAFAHLRGAWSFEEAAGQVAVNAVAGLNGQLGTSGAVDDGDPAWIVSGMVAAEQWSWSEIKEAYRP